MANLVLQLSVVILYGIIVWWLVTKIEGDDED